MTSPILHDDEMDPDRANLAAHDSALQLESYFRGLAHLDSDEPEDDGFPVQLSETARRLCETAPQATAESSRRDAAEQTPEPLMNMSTEPESSGRQEPEPPAQTGDDSRRSAARDVNELGIDWNNPASSAGEPVSEESPAAPRPAAPGRKTPERKKEEPARAESVPADQSAWEQLAHSLGVDAPVMPSPSVEERAPRQESSPSRRPRREAPAAAPPPPAETPAAAFGAGLLESMAHPNPAPRTVLDDMIVADEPAASSAEMEYGDTGFEDEQPIEPSATDYDSPEDDMDELDIDDDFVEFEIEELDPAARRGESSGESSRRETRTAENRGAEARGAENRSAESRDSETRASENRGAENRERPSRSREPVRERDDAGDDADESTEGERPRRGRRRSRRRGRKSGTRGEAGAAPSTHVTSDVDQDDDDAALDTIDATGDDGPDDASDAKSGGASGKPKNLPTWNETVGVIVQGNIDSRKKAPSRRRRGRRGGRRD